MEGWERKIGQEKEGGWLQDGSLFLSLTYKWNSAVEKESVV